MLRIVCPPNLSTSAILVVLLAIAANVGAEELSLPSRTPDLGVASAATLGTNDAGIGLAAGDGVPAFVSHSVTGEPVHWNELAEKGPLLVIFYRGGWCPYCNVQIRQLTLAYPEFEARGILPVLISADRPDAASLAQNHYEIPFPVLSDPDLQAHEAFGVTLEVDDVTVERYKEYGIDLEAWSGRDHHTIAVSSAFLVDVDGVVRWAHTSLDYKTRPSPEQLVNAADGVTW